MNAVALLANALNASEFVRLAGVVPAMQVFQVTTDTTSSASSQVTTTVVLTGTVSSQATQPLLSSSNAQLSIAIVLLLCILAGALFGLLLGYVWSIQKEYYKTARGLVDTGKTPVPDYTPQITATAKAALGGQPDQYVIMGGAKVIVGEESEFKVVKIAADGKRSDEDISAITWETDPKDAAAINPKSSTTVSLIAAKAGAFTLKAAKTSIDIPSKQIAAIAQQLDSNAVKLPTFTTGWGILAFVVVVIPLVALIAMAGVLSGEAVIGFLGGLAAGVVPGFVASRASDGGNNRV